MLPSFLGERVEPLAGSLESTLGHERFPHLRCVLVGREDSVNIRLTPARHRSDTELRLMVEACKLEALTEGAHRHLEGFVGDVETRRRRLLRRIDRFRLAPRHRANERSEGSRITGDDDPADRGRGARRLEQQLVGGAPDSACLGGVGRFELGQALLELGDDLLVGRSCRRVVSGGTFPLALGRVLRHHRSIVPCPQPSRQGDGFVGQRPLGRTRSAMERVAGTVTMTSRRLFIQFSLKLNGPSLRTCESSYTLGE